MAGARGDHSVAAPALRWPRLLAALALAGCGSSAPALQAPCQTRALTAVSGLVGLPAAKITATEAVANNGSPQCTYAAGSRSFTVNVDTTSQAYFIVERTAVEASQQFAPIPPANLPVQVPHLGLDAYWYPVLSQLETTDGVNVIAVTVALPGAPRAREIAAGTVVARAYLGKLHPPP